MTLKISENGVLRDATAEETAAIELTQADDAARVATQAEHDAARASALAKLSALGLTDAEIAALVGA